MSPLDADHLMLLSETAWKAREHARVYGPTRVGCAALASNGQVFSGCNIEHRFRSHDIHAEVNAISTLVANGGALLEAVLIAAERDRFTPCGSCLDWIFEVGSGTCVVISERVPGVIAHKYLAHELMPGYPA